MSRRDRASRPKSPSRAFVLIAIALAAFNLRPAVSSVGPIVDRISFVDFSDAVGAGLLVSVPVLLFGAANPLLQWVARHWRLNTIVLFSLLVLAASILLRSSAGPLTMIIGTVLVGVSIAFINIALPAVVRSMRMSQRSVTTATGIYSATLSIGAAVAAGTSVPLSRHFDLDWRVSLAMWAVPAFVAALFWEWMRSSAVPALPAMVPPVTRPSRRHSGSGVWLIAGFFGCQSMLYYSITTWLPSMLQGEGVDAVYGGTLLSIINWIGIPASFLIPYLCGFSRAVGWLATTCGVLWATGLTVVFFTPTPLVGAMTIGLAQGASLSLGLAMIVLFAADGTHAVTVSGTVQGIGYMIAACGPVLAGIAMLAADSWLGVKIGAFVVVAAMSTFGLLASARLGTIPGRPGRRTGA